jgi:hypothetical protein
MNDKLFRQKSVYLAKYWVLQENQVFDAIFYYVQHHF